MFIILRQFELNSLHRRRDDVDFADLTKAEVVKNSQRFSSDKVREALELALRNDQLLFLDLRILPKKPVLDGEEKESPLPELVLPDPDRFVYREQPTLRGVKTYRLEYILHRTSREVEPVYETTGEHGRRTVVVPAPKIERIESSLECDASDLAAAVKVLSSAANGGLSWLRITVHDDPLTPGRPTESWKLDFAEPSRESSRRSPLASRAPVDGLRL